MPKLINFEVIIGFVIDI